jgi:hypothetical protein
MAQILILTAEEGEKERLPLGEQNPQTFVSSYLLSHLNAYWQAIRIFIFLLSVLLAGEGRETLLFEKYSPAPPHGFSVDPGLLPC